MKAVFVFLLLIASAAAQDFIENPQPQKEHPPQTVNFWTFRQSWQDPPLRTNKQVLHSKTFWLVHGAYVAAVIVDIKYTHAKREDWASEVPPIPAIVGLDYLMDRFFTRSLSIEAPVYAIQHYVRDALR